MSTYNPFFNDLPLSFRDFAIRKMDQFILVFGVKEKIIHAESEHRATRRVNRQKALDEPDLEALWTDKSAI